MVWLLSGLPGGTWQIVVFESSCGTLTACVESPTSVASAPSDSVTPHAPSTRHATTARQTRIRTPPGAAGCLRSSVPPTQTQVAAQCPTLAALLTELFAGHR